MLEMVEKFQTESAKVKVLVAVAGALPEDAELREDYIRAARTIQDESFTT